MAPPNSASNDKSSSTVDGILNEISQSFAACKSTHWRQFFDASCKGGKECSINWTSNSILATPAASPIDSKSGSNNCDSSWLPSLDFWNTVNLTTGNGSSTSSSPSVASTGRRYTGSLPTMNQLLTENRIVSSVTQQLEERFTNFMANNTMQITTTGVFFGAIFGAAVATGVLFGMMAATGAIGSATLDYWPPFLQLLKRRMISTSPAKPKPRDDNDTDTTHTSSSSTTASVISTNGPLMIVQGHPSSSLKSAEEQCQSCLQTVESHLVDTGLEWTHIRRLTAYLVSGQCNATTFRQVLRQFNDHSSGNNHVSDPPLVSVLYVQQLEDDGAMLQIEAMASK